MRRDRPAQRPVLARQLQSYQRRQSTSCVLIGGPHPRLPLNGGMAFLDAVVAAPQAASSSFDVLSIHLMPDRMPTQGHRPRNESCRTSYRPRHELQVAPGAADKEILDAPRTAIPLHGLRQKNRSAGTGRARH